MREQVLPRLRRRIRLSRARRRGAHERSLERLIRAARHCPLVRPGDDLAALDHRGARAQAGLGARRDGDVVVVAQKVVSKAEGRYVDLADGHAVARGAVELAVEVDKDPRLVEVILSESVRVVRAAPGRAHRRASARLRHGQCRRRSVERGAGRRRRAACCCCRSIPTQRRGAARRGSAAHFGDRLGVIINDSFGRPWRRGTVGVAIGAAGLPALIDLRGQPDLFGRTLQVTEIGFADEIAAAASLLMGQADEAQPVVLVRGLTWTDAGDRRRAS